MRDGQDNVVLLIKGRPVRATPKQLALFACLMDEQGCVVPYTRLKQLIVRQAGVGRPPTTTKISREKAEAHLLAQYMFWIKKTLA